ncbi:MAG TPA: Wzz/FepE/Etk N-terminal domain-containing protein [Burkholderiaceae bacterium]
MPLSQLFAIFRARWKLALAVFVFVIAAAAVISVLTPRRYVATASVVIDVKADPIAGLGLQGMTAANYMATQTDVLNSARVAEEVVKNLSPEDSATLHKAWQLAKDKGSFEEWAVTFIRKGLIVLPSRESNVINLAYKASTPAFAMNMANGFVDSFVDTAINLRVQPAQQYKQFFERQVGKARDQLEEAQRKLAKFQQSHGIVVTDERLDVENSRLSDLSRELVIQQTQAADSGSRQEQSALHSDRISEVANNPAVAALRAEVVRARAALSEASDRLGDQHPKIIEMRTTLEELERSLRVETARAAGTVQATNAVNQGRMNQVRGLVDQQRSKVLAMTAARAEAGVLVRDVDGAQRAYDLVQNRLNQTTLESQSAQGNIAPLELAKLPQEAASPKPALNLAVGAFAGTLLGILATVLRELFDRRLRTADAVTDIIQQPLMVTVPLFNKDRALGFNARRALGGPSTTKRIGAT